MDEMVATKNKRQAEIDAGGLERLIEIGLALSAERNHARLTERILLEAIDLTRADGGTLYLRLEDDTLKFEIMRTGSLKIAMGGTTGVKTGYTNPSQQVLVSACLRDKREVIAVVMHDEKPAN